MQAIQGPDAGVGGSGGTRRADQRPAPALRPAAAFARWDAAGGRQCRWRADIWVWDFARQTFTRLTFDPAADTFPVWTPDGQRLIFASLREGPSTLYWRAADGTRPVERLVEDQNPLAPYALSPDGTRLVLGVVGAGPGRPTDISMLSLEGDGRVEPLLQTMFEEGNVDLSPDGRWIAYDSIETGRSEVYVRPFPDVEGGRWQVSTTGGVLHQDCVHQDEFHGRRRAVLFNRVT